MIEANENTFLKQAMMNIKWEAVKCHLCNSSKSPQPLILHGKQLVNGQFGYAVHPSICECGLVFLTPRWSKKDYDVFYENYYDDLYRLEIKPDYGISGVINNMEVIWYRIRDKINNNFKKVLDVGCGYGYGLKYLKEKMPNASIFGIESSPECCEKLQSQEVEAYLVTSDFDSNWTEKYKNEFDLVVLRHVVEHMLEPIQTLKKLKDVLSENGLIYISTPDMMHPRIELRDYDNWWEYWFRPVHPYYYSKETLMHTLAHAGLYPTIYGEENEEIWCLVSAENMIGFKWEKVYKKQKEVIDKYLE